MKVRELSVAHHYVPLGMHIYSWKPGIWVVDIDLGVLDLYVAAKCLNIYKEDKTRKNKMG